MALRCKVAFNRGYKHQSLVIHAVSFLFLVSMSQAGNDEPRKLSLLRERIRRLETRLSEDIALIREEFYHEINALTDDDADESVEKMEASSEPGVNESAEELADRLETLKNVLLTKLRVFDDGRKQEKRIRREIQDDVCTLKKENVDVAKLIAGVFGNIASKMEILIDKINETEKHEEIMESLEQIKTQLAKNAQTKSDDNSDRVPDCSSWLRTGHTVSGVYTVFPETIWRPIKVFCDMETLGGGWTVFQRRQDGSENFNRQWVEYTYGFGDLSGEFWLGNEFIHRLTSLAPQELRIELEDFENDHRYASYGMFSIGSAGESFKISLDSFTGNVTDSFNYHDARQFSTSDHGPSTGCSSSFKGGWWYRSCHAVNLNGLYLKGEHKSYADGINWKDWRGYHYSLKKTEMKFRPY